MPLDDLEVYYDRLRKKSEYDPETRKRLELLEKTLQTFKVTHNRSRVAGALIYADDIVNPQARVFLDWENQQVQFMLKMLAHFKQLQGKEVLEREDD